MAIAIAVALVLLLVAFLIFVALVRTLIGLALAVLVALIAGLIAESIAGETRRNPLYTLLFGFAGSVVGAIIARAAGLPRLISVGGLPVVWTIIGAIIVVFVWHLVRPERLQDEQGVNRRGRAK